MDHLAELTVGQLAACSGVTISALHFYERQNLITSRRTTGNQRRYGRDTLRRVALIRIAQRVGIPLAGVARVLSVLPGGRTPTPADWHRLSLCWKADLDQQMRCLEQLRADFATCMACGCMSIDRCPVIRPRDRRGAPGASALPAVRRGNHV
jgi:MerR family redox-sensitive transcriptional activator SoxR